MRTRLQFIILFIFSCLSSFSQNWNLVWREDFGVAEDTVIKDFPDPTMTVPNHHLYTWRKVENGWDNVNNCQTYVYIEGDECGTISDGFYGITNSTWWSYNRFAKCNATGSFFTPGRDHTGNDNGAMLVINSGAGVGEIIYSQDINFQLCDSRDYRFAIYASSITGFTAQEAMLTLKIINKTTNTEVGSIETNEIPLWSYTGSDPHSEHEWSYYYLDFTANDGDVLSLQVINNSISGTGNDFVLDDISLFRNDEDVKLPDLEIAELAVASQVGNTDACSYTSTFSLPASVLSVWKTVYDKVYFLWQKSDDAGLTWSNMTEYSGVEKTELTMDIDGTETAIYRVIVTGGSTDVIAEKQALYIAEHGAPENGCEYYSISNTLSSVKPEPNCKYKEGLRTIWSEDFGVCDSLSTKSCADATMNYYTTNADGIQYGNYVIASMPDTAVYKKGYQSWSDSYYYEYSESSKKDFRDINGLNGGAFMYCKANTTVNVFYEKNLSTVFCNCKAYMFNFNLYKSNDWSTISVTGRVLDKDGNVLGEQELKINGGSGGTWETATVPFSLPLNYTGGVKLQLLYTGTENYATFGIDNLSVTMCGDLSPQGKIGLNNDVKTIFAEGFDCNDETKHFTVDLFGLSDWTSGDYPNAGFVWQKSNDGGLTWTTLSETSQSIDYEAEEDKEIDYRVIIGETSAVAQQVAANGQPTDGCSVYWITNVAGLKCKLLGCKAPVYAFSSEDTVSICSDATENVVLSVEQSNTANVDNMQWYSSPAGTSTWTAITSETSSRLSVLPVTSTDYLFIAKNDTCYSDSIFARIDVYEAITMSALLDTVLCSGSDLTIEADLLTGSPTSYVWNGTSSTDASLSLSGISADQTVKVYATDGVCTSDELSMDIKVETPIAFTLYRDTVLCEGTSYTIQPNVTGTVSSVTWNIENDEVSSTQTKHTYEDYVAVADLTTTYKIVYDGNKCKSDSMTFTVTVEKMPELLMTASTDSICSGNSITLSVDYGDAADLVWESTTATDFASFATDLVASKSVSPTTNTTYRVRTSGSGACSEVLSNEVNIVVEAPLTMEMGSVPASVCAGNEVNLTSTILTGTPISYSWTRNSTEFSSELTTVDSPSETTEYELTVASAVCPSISKSVSVTVEKTSDLKLQISRSAICEGDTIKLLADYGELTTLEWESSTTGTYASIFSGLLTEKILNPTTTTDYRLKSEKIGGACPQVYSNVVRVTVEDSIDFTIDPVDAVVCAGTEVNLSATVSEGTPTVYSWSNETTILAASLSTTDTPAESSNYTLSVTGTVCPTVSKSVSVSVEKPVVLTLSADSNLICSGNSVPLRASFGESTSLILEQSTDDGSTFTEFSTDIEEENSVSPTVNTEYRIKTSGTGACEQAFSDIVKIEVEQPLLVELAEVPETVCAESQVNLSATVTQGAPVSYEWTKNDAPLSVALTATDEPTELTIYKFTVEGTACPSVSKSVTVDVEKSSALSLSASSTQLCGGDKVTLSATYGESMSLAWESSSDGVAFTNFSSDLTTQQTLTPQQTTIYRLKTAGTGACKQVYSDPLTVTVEQPIIFTIASIPAIVCEGTSIDLVATQTSGSAVSYAWTKNNTALASSLSATDVPVEATEYELTINGTACPSVSHSVSTDVEKKPSVTLSISETAVCEQTEIVLSAEQAEVIGLSWQRKLEGESNFTDFATDIVPSQTFLAEKSASFRLQTTGNQICESVTSNEVSLIVEDSVSVVLPANTKICPDVESLLSAEVSGSPVSLSWSKKTESDASFQNMAETTSSIKVYPAETTVYKILATATYCPSSEAETTVEVDVIPTLDIQISENEICEGTDVELSTSFPNVSTIIWESKPAGSSTYTTFSSAVSSLTLYPDESTDYRITAYSEANCPADPAFVSLKVDAAIDATVNDVNICEGQTASLKASGLSSYSYQWYADAAYSSLLASESTLSVTPDVTTAYYLKVTNGLCQVDLSASVIVAPIPTIVSCEEIAVKTYQVVTSGGTGTLMFDYNNGYGYTTSTELENVYYGKTYTITVKDELNCKSTYTLETPTYDITIPEYFDPGTETWVVENLDRYADATVSIYDRSGRLLLEFDGGELEGWDGTYNGNPMPSTDYWYVINVGEIDKQYVGHFTLIRQ